MRLWYVGRAVPWTALLTCLALAALCTGVTQRWPGTTGALLPLALASTAAAAAFVFDEVAAAVVSVTPRGGVWRRTSRTGVATAPGAAWLVMVMAAPAESGVDRPGWWVEGSAVVVLACAAALLASRCGIARPGATVASALVVLVTMPLVVGPLLPFDPVLPLGDFPDRLLQGWSGVATSATLVLAAAVGPSGRRVLGP